jgi:hypothetical protein
MDKLTNKIDEYTKGKIEFIKISINFKRINEIIVKTLRTKKQIFIRSCCDK